MTDSEPENDDGNDTPSSPESAGPEEALRRAFRAGVRRHVVRARKRQDRLEAECAECLGAKTLQEEAELLKASMTLVRRGMESVTVPDYFSRESGATRTIALDPARPPREQVQRLFRKAAKLEHCRVQATANADANRALLARLEKLLARFDAWRDKALPGIPLPDPIREEATALAVDWLPDGDAPPEPEKPKGRREREMEKLMQSVRIFTSHDGIEILVGKTAADNDTLTFRIARGNDWWFHLGAAPGSHVVVRSCGGQALPQETLLDAAHLCVHFSKMRTADRADVTYTQARHIRRIKGAPPGKVAVERSQSVFLRLERDRIERLLGHQRP